LSAEANVAAINLLKAEASASVTQQLNDHQIQKVNIPMGSIVGGSFFTGRGPFLPLDIHTGGSVITTLSGSFFDAGINQTCHQIYLNMTIYLTVLLPMERRMVELETEFLICETVLVGEVPESYTNIDFGNSEALSKIFGAND
jgi:sporulation protein YunB